MYFDEYYERKYRLKGHYANHSMFFCLCNVHHCGHSTLFLCFYALLCAESNFLCIELLSLEYLPVSLFFMCYVAHTPLRHLSSFLFWEFHFNLIEFYKRIKISRILG
jgi:hypothetical protein